MLLCHLSRAYGVHVFDTRMISTSLTSERNTLTWDGQLSLKCYLDALDSCYDAYQAKYAKSANAQSREVVNGAAANDTDNPRIDNLPLDDFNHILFHSPTYKLVSKAYARLLYNDYLTRPSHPEFNSVPAEILKVPRDQSFAVKAVEKLFMDLAKQRFE